MKYREDYLEAAERMYNISAKSVDRGAEHVVDYAMWLENQAYQVESRLFASRKTNSNNDFRSLERDLSKLFGGAF